MRTLILMRHAKAEPPEQADSDEARKLAPRGQRDAVEAGAALGAHQLGATLALVSPSARTRETAEWALADLSLEQRVVDDLYLASAPGLWQAFAGAEADNVLIVAHNPGIAELTSMLIAQAHDHSKLARSYVGQFPTSAWVGFEISGDMMRAAGPRLIAAWRPEKD